MKLAFAGTLATHLGGSIIDRAIGAALSILAWTLVGILFFLLGQLFVTLAPWNYYTDTLAPTRVIDWSVDGVRTAVRTLPMPPGHQLCQAKEVVVGVAGSILWAISFGYFTGTGPQYSLNDLLMDAAASCISGSNSGLLVPSQSRVRQLAEAADRNGLTKAGRALQKHSNRAGSKFGPPCANPRTCNPAGLRTVEEIIGNVDTAVVHRHTRNHGWVYDYRSPDGRGLRLRSDAQGNVLEFMGFLD